jgi:hypothetical protein
MTIKQQGGIFGRNPTFNETTSTTSNTDALYVTDKAGINATSSQIPALTRFQIGSVGSGSDATYSGRLKLDDQPASLQQGGGLEFMTSTFGSGYGWKVSSISSSGVHLVIGTRQNSADWTEVARFNSSGNLAFPSGQGIDFSATSGTGTSELFSDYEEGVYTPTLTPAGSGASGTITLNSSYDKLAYTKIGRLVTVTGTIIVSSVSSPAGTRVDISLPFTGGDTSDISERCCGLVLPKNLGSVGNAAIRVNGPSATVGSLVTVSSGTQSDIAATDFSGDEELQFTFSYIAS